MIENTFGINIVPENDANRLDALKRYRISDTPSEDSFDGIAKLATQIFNVPISLLSLVDAEAVFFKANVGMGRAKEANRGKSLCALAVLDKTVTVFEDALKEPCLMTNPNVVGDFGLRFYAGAPLITNDGFIIGTLCIIDQHPRVFTDLERRILEGLASTAMDQIELRRSALDTIDELTTANTALTTAQLDLKSSIEELAATNEEIEATNEELNAVHEDLNKSYELAVQLNSDLAKSELRFKTFIKKAPIAIGILNGRTLSVEVANDMLLNVWRKNKSVLGMPFATAMPELPGEPILSILDDVFTTGKAYTGKEVVIQLDSEGVLKDHYMDFIYEPFKNDQGETDSIIVIANDITDRVTARDAQQMLNDQLEMALRAGRLGAYSLEIATGDIICSAQWKSNYGLTSEDHITQTKLLEVVVPEYRDNVTKLLDDVIANQSEYHAEYVVKWPDESLHWINASGMLLYDADGKATHLTGVSVDITTRKNYEQQKDDFLSIASHELKTPITSLKASLQLLLKLKENPSHEMLPKLIEQSSKSMEKINALVNELLNMNRISEGQLQLEKTTFKISEMLDVCCDHVRVAGKYELVIKGDLDLEVFADEHRIDQVMVNLVNNAVKYASDSSEIQLIVEKIGDQAKVTVRDFGNGINAEVQPYLFDRYFRASYNGRAYSGLGLGLYISSEIIKRHGGKMGVDSKLGEGSSFWFTIPLK
ncbi:PAS domain-containing protein [Pedobacter petrophilus]|uniref:histidine kinase n=1 Tax=Pedobacter petrophilus TaxID=1908241 RepID=A0A7K0FWX1_9SPHI|nr:ATP-binding protein [Pedobacter petrophilus]MRX75236.1 PAS domain-containing protein [Pedobacter petrophilus]